MGRWLPVVTLLTIALVVALLVEVWLTPDEPDHAHRGNALEAEIPAEAGSVHPSLSTAARVGTQATPSANVPSSGTPKHRAVGPPSGAGPRTAATPVLHKLEVRAGHGDVLANAALTLTDEQGTEHAVTTNHAGLARATLRPGLYQVRAIDAVALAPVYLDGSPAPVAIRLAAAHAVHLRIRRDELPVALTRVDLLRLAAGGAHHEQLTHAETDQEGRVRLGPVPTGTYRIELPLEGGGRVSAAHEHVGAELRHIELPSDVTLRGRVIDERDAGLAGARVSITGTPSLLRDLRGRWTSQVQASAITDGSGAFELQIPLRTRGILAEVAADGFRTWRNGARGPHDERSRRNALVGQLWSQRGATIRLVPSAPSLTGIVRTADQRPLANHALFLRHRHRQPDEADVAVTTDAAGRFEAFSLRSGSWIPLVRTHRLVATDGRAYVAVGQTAPAQIEVVVRPLAVVSGRVQLPDGSPVAGARVWVTRTNEGRDPDAAGLAGEVRTDASGSFEIATGDRSAIGWYACAAWGSLRSAPRTLASDEMTLSLERPAELTLRVLDKASGAAVAGASVKLEPASGRGPRGATRFARETNDRGEVTQTLIPGWWQLSIQGPAVRTPQVETVDLSRRGPHSVTIQVDTGTSIGGRVTDPEGRPTVARVRVSRGRGSAWLQDVVTAGDGRFVFRGLDPEATYYIAVFSDDPTLGWTHASDVELGTGDIELQLTGR